MGQTSETETQDIQECECDSIGKIRRKASQSERRKRFIAICRSRPELDLKQCIGTYEFGLVPRSLFAADGTLLLAYHKAKIVQHLERLTGINQKENQIRNPAGESSMSDLRDTSDKPEKTGPPVQHQTLNY